MRLSVAALVSGVPLEKKFRRSPLFRGTVEAIVEATAGSEVGGENGVVAFVGVASKFDKGAATGAGTWMPTGAVKDDTGSDDNGAGSETRGGVGWGTKRCL